MFQDGRGLSITLAFCFIGCGDDSSANDSGVASATDTDGATDTDAEECIPGEERCECNDGQCLNGLTCASNICVALPEPPTASNTNGEESSGGGTSGGPTPCSSTSECASNQVCFPNVAECGDPWDAESFLLSIPEADVCPVDGAGGAEVYYEIHLDGEIVFTSAVSGCPPGWGNEEFELTDFTSSFSIEFWESDAFFDDFVTSLCWDTFQDGECGPVPRTILHDGQWIGSFGAEDAYSATIEFFFLQ